MNEISKQIESYLKKIKKSENKLKPNRKMDRKR